MEPLVSEWAEQEREVEASAEQEYFSAIARVDADGKLPDEASAAAIKAGQALGFKASDARAHVEIVLAWRKLHPVALQRAGREQKLAETEKARNVYQRDLFQRLATAQRRKRECVPSVAPWYKKVVQDLKDLQAEQKQEMLKHDNALHAAHAALQEVNDAEVKLSEIQRDYPMLTQVLYRQEAAPVESGAVVTLAPRADTRRRRPAARPAADAAE